MRQYLIAAMLVVTFAAVAGGGVWATAQTGTGGTAPEPTVEVPTVAPEPTLEPTVEPTPLPPTPVPTPTPDVIAVIGELRETVISQFAAVQLDMVSLQGQLTANDIASTNRDGTLFDAIQNVETELELVAESAANAASTSDRTEALVENFRNQLNAVAGDTDLLVSVTGNTVSLIAGLENNDAATAAKLLEIEALLHAWENGSDAWKADVIAGVASAVPTAVIGDGIDAVVEDCYKCFGGG